MLAVQIGRFGGVVVAAVVDSVFLIDLKYTGPGQEPWSSGYERRLIS